ncbi:S8 family serine peptidase [Krasilnikovia sp. MM14-A1004]|uniref:S8 family serine peptidase n=1 Tax=Krasilnikovia sp. MM14-A1004 TaxID=3373541 RepID=UPI00399D1A11
MAATSIGTVPAHAAETRPPAGYWITQLGVDRAWATSRGKGVVVGVVDTGVDADRPDLRGAVLPGREFPDLGDGLVDAWGHGTEVAVLIAGRGGPRAVTGVAPQASIVPAKVSGGAETVDEAMHWLVDQGASVINLSLGETAHGQRHQAAFDDGLRYAREHDVVIVAAAGNAGTDTGVVSPADRPGVVAVSAVDQTGAFRPDISVSGPEVAVAAPGFDMAADQPRQGAAHNGTSYSAAVVSGVVALIRSRYPGLPASAVVNRLLATADRTPGAGRDARYGYGIVNAARALTESVAPGVDAPLGSLAAPPPTRPGISPVAVLTVGSLALAVCGLGVWYLRRRRRVAVNRRV